MGMAMGMKTMPPGQMRQLQAAGEAQALPLSHPAPLGLTTQRWRSRTSQLAGGSASSRRRQRLVVVAAEGEEAEEEPLPVKWRQRMALPMLQGMGIQARKRTRRAALLPSMLPARLQKAGGPKARAQQREGGGSAAGTAVDGAGMRVQELLQGAQAVQRPRLLPSSTQLQWQRRRGAA